MNEHSNIPELQTALSPKEVQSRLLAMAKRGKLPEYRALGASGGQESFVVPAFGAPFDRLLTASVGPGAGGAGSSIRFVSRLAPKLPVIAIVLVIVSFEPGEWLTRSMLNLYWPWYREHVVTWWWYMPLMVLSLPMMWKQYKNSEAVAAEETTRVVQAIAKELDARIIEPGTST